MFCFRVSGRRSAHLLFLFLFFFLSGPVFLFLSSSSSNFLGLLFLFFFFSLLVVLVLFLPLSPLLSHLHSLNTLFPILPALLFLTYSAVVFL